jgi:F420-dependent oxidoreductase-like protein
VKLGLEIGGFGWDGGAAKLADTLAEFARTADDAGVDLLAAPDHVWQGPHMGGPEEPMLECFTTLATLAAHTTKCRLLSGVAAVHFRNPALLAKTVTTLDVLSRGRAMLGIGVGWDADEADGLGFAFPELADRFAMLEETLQICHRMWAGEHGDDQEFTGAHYRLGRALNLPQSTTRPRPPILVGGDGPRRTLRLVAKYGDACNVNAGPDVPAKLDTLRRHCDAENRDYAEITKTAILPFELTDDAASVDALLGELRELDNQGIDIAIGIVLGRHPVEVANLVADKVLPEVSSW